MTVIKYGDLQSEETILSTEMNTLGDGANKTSGVFSNDDAAELDLFATFELALAATSSRSDDAHVKIYILPASDGTNYATGGDSTDPLENDLAVVLSFDTGSGAARTMARDVPLPPLNFKVLVMNELGVSFASSGNVLTMRRYNYEAA
jgi:hypothetical protein